MNADEFGNQQRELLDMMASTLWVLEHPEVNAIKFCGNPRELARRIRQRMAQEAVNRAQNSAVTRGGAAAVVESPAIRK